MENYLDKEKVYVLDRDEILITVFDKEDELQIARRELAELTTNVELENKKRIVDNLENQISEKEQQIVILQKRIVNNTKLYSKINNAPVSCCPTCEQEIKDNDCRDKNR